MGSRGKAKRRGRARPTDGPLGCATAFMALKHAAAALNTVTGALREVACSAALGAAPPQAPPLELYHGHEGRPPDLWTTHRPVRLEGRRHAAFA
jgi:hypothetical protein